VKPTAKQIVRVPGGAYFPATVGTMNLSWPLVAATADDQGLRIQSRLSFVKWESLDSYAGSPKRGVNSWSASWSEISRLDVGRRSLVPYLPNRRGCRFVSMSRRKLARLVAVAVEHGVEIHQVRGTLGWIFKN
jgi:hypothetical protein